MNRARLVRLMLPVSIVASSIMACGDAPTRPLGNAMTSERRMTDGDVVESVCGNAHLAGGEIERTATFEIRKYADGRVAGWYHALRRGPGGANIRVRVECLHVVGDQAWATGTVFDAVNPDHIGRPYSFRFHDRGEGEGSMPDEVGVARFQDYDCTTEPDIPLRELTTGNLQVRG